MKICYVKEMRNESNKNINHKDRAQKKKEMY